MAFGSGSGPARRVSARLLPGALARRERSVVGRPRAAVGWNGIVRGVARDSLCFMPGFREEGGADKHPCNDIVGCGVSGWARRQVDKTVHENQDSW